MKKKDDLNKLLTDYGIDNSELTDKILVLFGVIKSVCPNPECKSKNITHTETYSYCEDCRRMFNGQNVL